MTRPPHTCSKHPEPVRACYASCRCRCYGCTAANSDAERQRTKQIAYGRWEPYVDAEPVRQHVRDLMAPKVGSTRGMGWKRIAEISGVPNSTLWKLLYGDEKRGRAPSKRCRHETAAKLLAVEEDLADGATVPSGPTLRKLQDMVEGGFAKAELGRYLTGNPGTRSLQIATRRYVTAGHAEAVHELHRRWKAGEIIPRGRHSRHEYGPPSPFPATPAPSRCVDCGDEPWHGGLRCEPCYFEHANPGATPTGCGTDAGYTAHRRRGEVPCQRCRDAHAQAHRLRQTA